jgi:3-hydroxyisobutyrate dehydrogenase-like beta-hydroxyacid dehydrogenase
MEIQKIGILSIGEMGSACARLFLKNGARVITVLEGRSERTRMFARDAGVEVVRHVRGLVDSSDIILSLVTPSSALSVCKQVAQAMVRQGGASVFVDANPTSPMLAEKMAHRIASVGRIFVDGAVIGPAAEVGRSTVLYGSGPNARELQQIERFGLKVSVLGEKIGQASALKIFNAGLNKGMAALLTELLMGAKKAGILNEVVNRYNVGFEKIINRMDGFLTGLAQHARRRSEEMVELQATLRHWGIKPVMTHATKEVLGRMASLHLVPIENQAGGFRILLTALVEKGFLSLSGSSNEGAKKIS